MSSNTVYTLRSSKKVLPSAISIGSGAKSPRTVSEVARTTSGSKSNAPEASTPKGMSSLKRKWVKSRVSTSKMTPIMKRMKSTEESFAGKPSPSKNNAAFKFHKSPKVMTPFVNTPIASKSHQTEESLSGTSSEDSSEAEPTSPRPSEKVLPSSERRPREPSPTRPSGGYGKIGKVQDFTGSLEEDVENWFGHFEMVAQGNRWDNLAKSIQLYSFLKGQALKWYGTLLMEEKQDYEVVRALMIQEFHSENRREDLYNQVKKRKQQENESVNEYALDMERYLRGIDPHMGEREKINYFLEGLKSKYRYQVIRKRVRSLREAVEAAKDEEIIEKQNQTFDSKSEHSDELSHKIRKLEDQNRELEKKLEQHKNVQTPTQTSTKRNYNARTFPEARRWTNDGKPICSNCLKVGHIAKDCRLGGKSMRRSFSPPYGRPNYYPYPPRRPNNSAPQYPRSNRNNEPRRDNRNPPRTPPNIKKEPTENVRKVEESRSASEPAQN